MTSIYVTRPSTQLTTHSLFLKEGADIVLSLDNTVPPGKVLRSVAPSFIRQDEGLTYNQILMLFLKADKVIVL